MKTLNLAEHYIRKIKDFVEKAVKVQVKILCVDQVSKNLLDLVSISQKLFILQYKVREGHEKTGDVEGANLLDIEAKYRKMSAEEISDEIISLTSLADALIDITNSYKTP
jgi:predicted RNA-binding protein with RPS1 domain